MKTNYIGFLFCMFVLFACHDNGIDDKGEGYLALGVSFNSQTHPTISVRSGEQDYSAIITDTKGRPLYTYSRAELPNEIRLNPGTYSAKITSGSNPNAAFSSPYFTGSKDFVIKANETSETTVECLLSNTKVSVAYSDRIKQYFSAYQTTISVPQGSITYTEENTQAGYFKVEQDSVQLTWKLSVCNMSGQVFTRSGSFYAQKRWHYTLNFDIPEQEETEEGGIKVEIVIKDDLELVNSVHQIELTAFPSIEGDGFDVTVPIALQLHQEKNYKIYIKGNPKLDSIYFSHNCPALQDQEKRVPPHSSLMGLSNDAKQILEDYGLLWECAADSTTASMDFTGALLSKLEIGNYDFSFEVLNTAGKKTTTTFRLAIVDADVLTLSPPAGTSNDVWTHHARLAGSWITNNQPSDLQIRYREQGTENWTFMSAEEINDGKFYITANNLKAATTYEYQALSKKNGAEAYANILTFTTESATPLPNGSFDDWYKDGKLWCPWAQGDESFWDTGNTGAIKAGESISIPSSDLAPGVSGQSAQLTTTFASVFGIGKLAAGNIFAGKYVRTDVTDGVLSFGRPYTSRPKRLKGMYKYNSSSINKYSTKNPDLSALNGKPDSCYMYIALIDSDQPVEIRTKESDRNLFNSQDPSIIAYAEYYSAENTSSWEEFNLELDYRSTDRKPKYIVIVFSASKYGDYFTGGDGSVLQLDELKLEFK